MVGTMVASSWSLFLRGLLALVFAGFTLAWPGLSLDVLITFFGVFTLISGFTAIGAAVQTWNRQSKPWALLLNGIISILAGLIAIFRPFLALEAIIYVVGAWAIIMGITEIMLAIELRKQIANEWMLILGGVISILFGLSLLIFPFGGLLAAVWLIATFAIIYGIVLIALAVRLRQWTAPANRLDNTKPAVL